jgi:hypothetical protein
MRKGVLSVEKCEKRKPSLTLKNASVFRACSACAGDYEDPDATAPFAESEPNDEVGPEEDFRELQEGLRS